MPDPLLDAPPSSDRQAYLRYSRTATYGFLAALPLLLAYHVLILLANVGSPRQVRVGAEVWIQELLALLGAAGMTVLGALVVVVGIVVFAVERPQQIPIRRRYFGWMLAESAAYAVGLAILIGWMVGLLFAAAPVTVPLAAQVSAQSYGMKLALSFGAGIYEELVFRVILVGGLFWTIRRAASWERGRAYAVAAIVGALLFSAVHYLGPLGDPFALPSFTFRFLFGLALNAVFLLRGFGIAAWTHALYDVLVVTFFA